MNNQSINSTMQNSNINNNNMNNNDQPSISLWASVHKYSEAQRAELSLHVLELEQVSPELFSQLTNLAEDANLEQLATALLITARALKADLYQPAGSLAFQLTLGKMRERLGYNVRIFYAKSRRISKEVTLPDGSVRKVSDFKHLGFQEV
jgi:hypothetical protein